MDRFMCFMWLHVCFDYRVCMWLIGGAWLDRRHLPCSLYMMFRASLCLQAEPGAAVRYLQSWMMTNSLPQFLMDRRQRRAHHFLRIDSSWTGNPGYLRGSRDCWTDEDGDDTDDCFTIWYQYERTGSDGGIELTLDGLADLVLAFLGPNPRIRPCRSKVRIVDSLRFILRNAADEEPHFVQLWSEPCEQPLRPLDGIVQAVMHFAGLMISDFEPPWLVQMLATEYVAFTLSRTLAGRHGDVCWYRPVWARRHGFVSSRMAKLQAAQALAVANALFEEVD